MTLIEHLRELRSRLFKACLGIVGGMAIALFFAQDLLVFLTDPYCDYQEEMARRAAEVGAQVQVSNQCGFALNNPTDVFMLTLRTALYAGLIIGAPIWLYQLWAFIAPGLHRHERRYTYIFASVAFPLFVAGATLAYLVVEHGLEFFLGLSEDYQLTVNLNGYYSFITGVMLLFGVGFEFPLIVVMLNFTGLVSARRLLGWWRVAVFCCFLFAAIVTPTPDPFGMTALALPMALMYFGAVGVAFLNDRRRRARDPYAGLSDDEASPLEDVAPISPAAPLDRSVDEDST